MPDQTLSQSWRIALLVVAVALVVGGGLTAAVAVLPNQATAQSSFSVPDTEIEAEQIDSVVIGTDHPGVEWTDLPEPAQRVEFRFYVENPDGEMVQAGTEDCDPSEEWGDWGGDCVGDTAGTAFYGNLWEIDPTEAGWSSDDFEAEPGSSKSTTISVRFEAEVFYDNGSVSDSVADSGTITVTNPAETADPEATASGGDVAWIVNGAR